ncbi:DUF2550 domain-containing protein [Nocardiopsis coralliicola]
MAGIALRRHLLERRGGAVECYLRPCGGERTPPWRIGLGRYGTTCLVWWRVFSLWPRPAAALPRRGLVVVGRRRPDPGDLEELTPELHVVAVGWSAPDGSDPAEPSFELAMGPAALTGFLSWVESAPPGTPWEQ